MKFDEIVVTISTAPLRVVPHCPMASFRDETGGRPPPSSGCGDRSRKLAADALRGQPRRRGLKNGSAMGANTTPREAFTLPTIENTMCVKETANQNVMGMPMGKNDPE